MMTMKLYSQQGSPALQPVAADLREALLSHNMYNIYIYCIIQGAENTQIKHCHESLVLCNGSQNSGMQLTWKKR